MKTKHTKGKWNFIAITSDETGEDIALIKAMSSGCSRNDESLANAKLIAQSPELLKVCMDLMYAFQHKEGDIKGNKVRTDIFKYCPEFGELAVKTRSVIGKATE